MKKQQFFTVRLEKVVSGGRCIADVTLADGQVKKAFIWGGLPGELVKFLVTKKRAGIYEGVVTEVLEASEHRVEPLDKETYLSTSPWQIYDYGYELELKSELIKQAFGQQQIEIDAPVMITDGRQYNYRNKMEFCLYWDHDTDRLSLANYRRGTKGKIPVVGSNLAMPIINQKAQQIVDILNQNQASGRDIKTLLIRANQAGQVAAQLYVKTEDFELDFDFSELDIKSFDIIYSSPKSPASVITERLASFGQANLDDQIMGRRFSYATEGFFQINLPVYELALQKIKQEIDENQPIIDLYSGVGTIGLTVSDQADLVEINQFAINEMTKNIAKLGLKSQAILSPAEKATDYIVKDKTLIVDPPRAGLHQKVVDKILEVKPEKVIYLSCNPITQARDLKLLLEKYKMTKIVGYNFFPRTPHIENLVILEKK